MLETSERSSGSVVARSSSAELLLTVVGISSDKTEPGCLVELGEDALSSSATRDARASSSS
jgi:hypothetical protein